MADTDNNAKTVGRNITNLLIESEKTQQELADAIGVSKSTVSTWVNGKRMPRMPAIDRMCKFFGVPRTVILGDIEIEDPSKLFHDTARASAQIIPCESDEEFRRRVLEIVNEQRQQQQYYEDEVVQAVTDRLRTNPEYGVMFKAASNVRPEEVEFVTEFIKKMSD